MLSLLGHHDGWLLVTSHRQVAPLKTRTKNVSALSRVKGYSTVPTDLWTDWKFTQKLNLKIFSIHPDLSTMAGEFMSFFWERFFSLVSSTMPHAKSWKRRIHSITLSPNISLLEDETKSSSFWSAMIRRRIRFLHTVAIQAGQKFQSNLRR